MGNNPGEDDHLQPEGGGEKKGEGWQEGEEKSSYPLGATAGQGDIIKDDIEAQLEKMEAGDDQVGDETKPELEQLAKQEALKDEIRDMDQPDDKKNILGSNDTLDTPGAALLAASEDHASTDVKVDENKEDLANEKMNGTEGKKNEEEAGADKMEIASSATIEGATFVQYATGDAKTPLQVKMLKFCVPANLEYSMCSLIVSNNFFFYSSGLLAIFSWNLK